MPRFGFGLRVDRSGGGGAQPTTLIVDTLTADGTWTCPAGVTSAQVELWAAGGGGVTATGGGGGGAYSRGNAVSVTPSTGYAVAGLAGAAAATSAANATFASTTVVAEGGKSGTTQAGGAAANGTGDVKFSGGNGQAGAGNTVGGSGAGSAGNGAQGNGGEPNGGFSISAATGARIIGAGGGSQAAAQFVGMRGEARITYEAPATAGFPRVRGRSFGRDTANGTSRAVTMPSGITAGELLVIVVATDGTATITESGGGWTALAQVTEGTSQLAMRAFYKVAAGGDTATIATSASEQVAYTVFRIAGAGTPEWTTASGNSTNADAPNHTPSGGSAKYLWIAAAAWDASAIVTISGIPANYASFITEPSFNPTGVMLASVERFLEASSENPGAFTSETEQWAAATLSIPPA